MRYRFKTKPQTVFLILGLIYGLSFLIVNPPFQGSDEGVHFFRAVDISEGHIAPKKIGEEAGVIIPKNIETIGYNFPWNTISYQEKGFTIKDIFLALKVPYNYQNKNFVDISRVAVVTYPPFPYLGSALSIFIGKAMNLPPLILLYTGRFSCLIVWLLLTYLAIKITPVHKWVFLMLSLMPTTIFQATSLSADGFTIGLTFLIIALLLKFALDKDKRKITAKDILILSALFLMLTLSKPFYFLLIFLFFIIPVKKFKNKKNMFSLFTFIFSLMFITGYTWYSYATKLYRPENMHTSIPDQLNFMLSGYFNFSQLIFNTLSNNLQNYLIEFVGKFGWILYLPMWLVTTYLILLFIFSLLDKNEVNINFNQKMTFFGAFIIISILIFSIEYIAWTAVGQNTIDGIMGRYFLPIAPLIFLLFNNKFNFDIKRSFKIGAILIIIFFLSISLILMIKKFYIL